jgi:hypothetical protein
MRHYKVGDKVWIAYCGTQKVEKPCPICFGKKEVILILGNEDRVVLPCEYCELGFSNPRGVVTECEYIAEPKMVIIEEVVTTQAVDGERNEYRYNITSCSCLHLDEDEVFDTRENALIKCAEVIKEREEEQITRTERIKANQRKSFAWNAGYHLGEAKKNKEEAERHEKLAKLCNEHSKSESIRL